MTIGNTKVTISLTAFVADTGDPDDLPDETALTGVLTLDPQITGGPLQFEDSGVTKLKAITKTTVPIGPSGEIQYQGKNYIRVPAPTPEDSNLTSLVQYKASFTGVRVGAIPVEIPPIYFTATPGVTVNLADEVDFTPATPTGVTTRGPRGYGITDIQDIAGEIVVTYATDDGPVQATPIPLTGIGVRTYNATDTGDSMKLIVFSNGTTRAIPVGADPPGTPTISGTAFVSRVVVTWPAPPRASQYIVYRNGTRVAEISSLEYNDYAVTPNSTYLYKVVAVDPYGQISGLSNEYTAFIDPALNVAPTVEIRTWPTVLPASGTVIVRVNSKDIDAQTLSTLVSVSSGYIAPTTDPSVWLLTL